MTDNTSSATLYLLTGPWGAGKSTLIPYLARLLPEVVVFDWDLLLPGLSAATGKNAPTDASTWEGLKMMWVAIIEAVLAGGRDVLLCGPGGPDDFAESPLAAYPSRCAYLDCADAVLAARLRNRGESEAAISDELAMMASLRESKYRPFVVGEQTPQQLAEAIAAWVFNPGRPAPVRHRP